MTPELDRFRSEYASAFIRYLAATGESELESAYELGRSAVTGELSLLDLSGIHHAVLAQCLTSASSPQEIERVSAAGADFFREALATFDMTQRGFLEAQETAQLEQRHASQLRGLADAALAVNSTLSVDEMLDLVSRRAREVIGAVRAIAQLGDAPEDNPPQRGPDRLVARLIDRDGRPFGSIEVTGKREGDFTEDDESILVQLAQMTSVAIENVRLYEHERGIAATLQRNLLPSGLPDVPGVGAAARYLAGGAGVEVGGDWYELIPLASDKVGVAIGDVVGRGVRAAAIMGQLRVALRAYALEFESPAVVARRLAGFFQTIDPNQMATCVYAVLEPESGLLSYTNAGHPPPLLLGSDNRATYLEGDPGLPLGVIADTVYTEASVTLAPGSTLLLYTDGLVEERGQPIDVGLERLRSVVADSSHEPDLLCDRVLDELVDGAAGDDVALLAVHSLPLVSEPLLLTLPADPATLLRLRRTLKGWLRHAGASAEESHDIVLATCEAAANAIEHAYGPGEAAFELDVRVTSGDVTVGIRDRGRWRPPRDPRRGRGLPVMRELMDAVEVDSTAEGTNVLMRRTLGDRQGR
jgi:serine phosphatase RsbU (regulator of sigma subunit)/anti-sigma regulatory factor (Ser/Thr protein kinase)